MRSTRLCNDGMSEEDVSAYLEHVKSGSVEVFKTKPDAMCVVPSVAPVVSPRNVMNDNGVYMNFEPKLISAGCSKKAVLLTSMIDPTGEWKTGVDMLLEHEGNRVPFVMCCTFHAFVSITGDPLETTTTEEAITAMVSQNGDRLFKPLDVKRPRPRRDLVDQETLSISYPDTEAPNQTYYNVLGDWIHSQYLHRYPWTSDGKQVSVEMFATKNGILFTDIQNADILPVLSDKEKQLLEINRLAILVQRESSPGDKPTGKLNASRCMKKDVLLRVKHPVATTYVRVKNVDSPGSSRLVHVVGVEHICQAQGATTVAGKAPPIGKTLSYDMINICKAGSPTRRGSCDSIIEFPEELWVKWASDSQNRRSMPITNFYLVYQMQLDPMGCYRWIRSGPYVSTRVFSSTAWNDAKHTRRLTHIAGGSHDHLEEGGHKNGSVWIKAYAQFLVRVWHHGHQTRRTWRETM